MRTNEDLHQIKTLALKHSSKTQSSPAGQTRRQSQQKCSWSSTLQALAPACQTKGGATAAKGLQKG